MLNSYDLTSIILADLTLHDPVAKARDQRLAEKRDKARGYLGDKWVLHPKHAPKNKNRAVASSRFFLGV